jgi:hypothetical protein
VVERERGFRGDKPKRAQKAISSPHTAVCFKAAKLGSSRVKIIRSAEWMKFAPSLPEAFGDAKTDDRETLVIAAKRFNVSIQPGIAELFNTAPLRPAPIAVGKIENKILARLPSR